MGRIVLWCVGLLFALVPMPVSAKVQCSCPKVPADGEGNTSCSASENSGRCTIDFNLFGPESEKRAVELLTQYGKTRIEPPEPGVSAVEWLNTRTPQQLVDAVLVYMTVAAGNQKARSPNAFPLDGLRELVEVIRSDSLSKLVSSAFGQDAQKKWSTYSDESLRGRAIPFDNIRGAVVSPGCVEFTTTSGLWVMFKASWSPARVTPGCGGREK